MSNHHETCKVMESIITVDIKSILFSDSLVLVYLGYAASTLPTMDGAFTGVFNVATSTDMTPLTL